MAIYGFLSVIFIILFVSNYTILFMSKKSNQKLLLSLGASLALTLIVWVLIIAMKKQVCNADESFRFEVSPKRKQCLDIEGKYYCPPPNYYLDCCAKGFNGKNVWFEYSSDADRFQGKSCKDDPSCCSCRPLVKAPDSYWCSMGI